jgi:hypothetical protein
VSEVSDIGAVRSTDTQVLLLPQRNPAAGLELPALVNRVLLAIAASLALIAATPAPRATHPPKVPRLAADAPPRIIALTMSSNVVHAGDSVRGSAITSSNVTSVEVHVAAFGASMRKVGVGHFTLDYTMASFIPFFFYGTYTVHVIARNSRGDMTTRDVALTIQ